MLGYINYIMLLCLLLPFTLMIDICVYSMNMS